VATDWRAAARLLGLGARARNVVVGVEGVRRAAFRNKLFLAIVAADASQHSSGKIVPLLRARGVTLIVGPDATELGAAVGRHSVAAIGLVDSELASGVMRVIEENSHPQRGEREV
jgi:ribosomal protein L7Ae-like RNA K-turn-binding protein